MKIGDRVKLNMFKEPINAVIVELNDEDKSMQVLRDNGLRLRLQQDDDRVTMVNGNIFDNWDDITHSIRNQLVEDLKENVLNITFLKKDGDRRTMRCTLDGTKVDIPETKGSNKKPNLSICSVWDLDLNQWRSFRVESVISVEKDK